MSATQWSHFILIRQVLRQLRAFGLNPRDWKIERNSIATPNASANLFDLHHRRDRDFKMRAVMAPSTKGFAKLETLKVVSL